MITSGTWAGKTAEIFVPSTGQHCQLTDLPGGRYYTGSENYTVCGGEGEDTKTSCHSLTSGGTWEKTSELLESRVGYSSWASPSGLMLLGGWYSRRTTEMIQENGTSSYNFTLEYDT